MNGFIEITEDQFDDTIEHLRRIKALTCKLIKKMAENSDVYTEGDDEEETETRMRVPRRRGRSRYDY